MIQFGYLFAKVWAIGYALTGLGVLLGMLAVLIPSMRRGLKKKGEDAKFG